MPSQQFDSSGTWPVPAGADPSSVRVQAWGEGNSGGNGLTGGSSRGGGGGSGGEYSEESALGGLTPGVTVLNITIGSGSTGVNTQVTGGSVAVIAHAGNAGSANIGGGAATGSTNSIHHDSGKGGNSVIATNPAGGGGGEAGGSTAAGGAGANGLSNGTGAAGGTGGDGGDGGQGGSGLTTGNAGHGGLAPGGGGGGGSGRTGGTSGGQGASGRVIITWSVVPGVVVPVAMVTVSAPMPSPAASNLKVTATAGGSAVNGLLLRVRVLDNAALPTNLNTATQSATGTSAAMDAAFTPAATGSLAYSAVTVTSATPAAATGNTAVDSVASHGTFVSTATLTANTPFTAGSSTAVTVGGAAVLEVTKFGGTIATDASSPAVVNATGATTATTAAFAPPTGGKLLLALVSSLGGTGQVAMAVSDSFGLTWTQAVAADAAGDHYAGIWYAYSPSSLSFIDIAPDPGTAGLSYSYLLSAAGGYGNYGWTVATGSLPAGLSLNGSTGEVSGTPTTAGLSTFTLTVSDGFGNSATTGNVSLVVNEGTTPGGVIAATWSGAAAPYSYGTLDIPVANADHDWLFVSVSWVGSEDSGIAYVADDAHNQYEPCAFTASGVNRTQVFSVPNARAAGHVYVSTSAYVRWLTACVTDVTGLQPGFTLDVAPDAVSGGPGSTLNLALSTLQPDFILAAGAFRGIPQAVTSSGTGATWTAIGWGGVNGSSVDGLTQALAWAETAGPASPAITFTGNGAMGVGAFLDPSAMGPADWNGCVTQWTGYGLPSPHVARHYKGVGNYTVDSDMNEMIANGVKICLSLSPAYNPVSSSDHASIVTMMQALKAAGANVEVALWHEPFYAGLTSGQYIAMVQYYADAVRPYYPLVFVTSVSSVQANSENSYYPGDAWVDKCATDFYCFDYAVSGYTLTLAATPANNASPPKPFGIWECGSSTDPVLGQNSTQYGNFITYMQSYMQGRLTAGQVNADVLWFNGLSYNLLTGNDSSFEGGVGHWVAASGCTIASSTAQAHTGTHSMAVTATGAGSASVNTLNGTSGNPVTAGTVYTYAAWVRAATVTATMQLGVNWYNSAGTFLSSSFPSGGTADTTSWTQIAITVTAPAGAAFAQVVVQTAAPGGAGVVHYVDDVTLSVQTHNATVMGFGFGSSPSTDYRISPWNTLSTALNGQWPAGAGTFSGCMVAVYRNGGLPVNANPAWPVIKCQAAFGYLPHEPTALPVWTDITSRFLGFKGGRGRSFELDEISAADVTVTLDNFDGALSPQNTTSPYYPNVTLITPVRLVAAWQGRTYSLFRGIIHAIPQTYDFQRGMVEVAASDDWSKLPQTLLAQCMIQEMLYDKPLHLWPLNEQQGALGASNWSGRSAVSLAPTPATLAAPVQTGGGTTPGSQFAVSIFGKTLTVSEDALPATKPSVEQLWFTGGVHDSKSKASTSSPGPAPTPTTPTTGFGNDQSKAYPSGLAGTADSTWGNTTALTASNYYQGSVLVDSGDSTLPLTSSTWSVWARMYYVPSNTNAVIMMLSDNAASTGSAVHLKLSYDGTNITATQTTGSHNFTPPSYLFDSRWHLWTVTISSGGVLTLYLDGASLGSYSPTFPSGTPTMVQWGGDSTATTATAAGIFTGQQYLAGVVDRVVDSERIVSWAQSGMTGFVDELAGQRISRILTWARWGAAQAVDRGVTQQQEFNYLGGGYASNGISGAVGNFATAGGAIGVDSGAQADMAIQDVANSENAALFMAAGGELVLRQSTNASPDVGIALGDMDYALNSWQAFEDGLGPWTSVSGCTVAVDPGWSYAGEQSALVTVTGTPSQAFAWGDRAAVTPGGQAGFSCWVMSPQGCTASPAIDFYTAANSYISTANPGAVFCPPMTPVLLRIDPAAAAAPAGAAWAYPHPVIGSSPAAGTQLYFDRPRLSPAGFQASYQDNLQVVEDVQYLYNDIVLTRNVDQAGYRVRDEASRQRYYPRVYTRTVYSSTDDPQAVADVAGELLSQFSQPQLRVAHLEVNCATDPENWAFVLAAGIGDSVSFSRHPVGGAAVTGDFVVLHIEPDLGPDKASFTYVLAPSGFS